MALLRKILIAVDGSEPSENALRIGCRLGRGERARIMAVTVAPPYEGDLSLVGVRNLDGLMHEPCAKGFAACRKVAQEEGVVAEHLSTTGAIAERIVATAGEYGCDLVVLGCERHPWVWRWLAGSVVTEVIAASPCDVLVVPRDAQFDWKTFMVVIKEAATAVHAAEPALELARAYGARLLIATTRAPSRNSAHSSTSIPEQHYPDWERARFMRELRLRAESLNVRVDTTTLEGRLGPAMISLSRRESVGMTIIGQETLSFGPACLRSRLTALTLQRFLNPVLVLRAASERA